MSVQVLANPLFDPSYQTEHRTAVSQFHQRLPGFHQTPLRPVTGFGPGRVFVKNESQRLGLPAFKILGASWAAVNAIEERFDVELCAAPTFTEIQDRVAGLGPITLVTATDGNHGRAIAYMARHLGLNAHILVPRGTTAPRIAAIRNEGGIVDIVEGDYDAAVKATAALSNGHNIVVSDTSWPGYDAIPNHVIDGYLTIFEEVSEQFGQLGMDRPDTVVIPTGVGALTAAAARWYRDPRAGAHPAELVTVEPTTAACVLESMRAMTVTTTPGPHTSSMAGLNCGTPSPLAWNDIAPSVRWATAIDDADAEAAMRILADNNLIAGESGAASAGLLHGLLNGPVGGDPAEIDALVGRLQTGVTLLLVTEGATDPDEYRRIVGDRTPQNVNYPTASGQGERTCVS